MTTRLRSLVLAAALAATAAVAAGASAAPGATLPGTQLAPVKTYLLDPPTQLHRFTQGVPCGREPLLRDRQGGELRLSEARAVGRRPQDIARAKTLWTKGNPLYERIEGIVAGTPSLADYDVSSMRARAPRRILPVPSRSTSSFRTAGC